MYALKRGGDSDESVTQMSLCIDKSDKNVKKSKKKTGIVYGRKESEISQNYKWGVVKKKRMNQEKVKLQLNFIVKLTQKMYILNLLKTC